MTDIFNKNNQHSEQFFVLNAYNKLKSLNVPCVWECPLLGRSIDLLYYKDNFICSVEFKLNNWKKALVQARDHQLGADLAYICMPEKKISDKIKKEAQELNIGILELNESEHWPFVTILPAKKSEDQWCIGKEKLIKQLQL